MKDDPTLRGNDIRTRPATAAEARAAAALARRFAQRRERPTDPAVSDRDPMRNPDGNLKANDLVSTRTVSAKEKAATAKIADELAAERTRTKRDA